LLKLDLFLTMPASKFKIIGHRNVGTAEPFSQSKSEEMVTQGFRKQEEPESFWPADGDEYVGWRKAQVKKYFDSFPVWAPFMEKWSEMSNEEKRAHPGVPTIEEVCEIKGIEVPSDPAAVEFLANKEIPNLHIASTLTSSRSTREPRGISSCDKSKVCWERFNDAYECHLRGLPTAQCMNFLGRAYAMCPNKVANNFLEQISAGNFSGRKSVRQLLGHGNGHH